MEKYDRKSVCEKLSIYDHLAKEGSFVEVTAWHNGEGFDVSIDDRLFQFTYGEFETIKKLIKKLYK